MDQRALIRAAVAGGTIALIVSSGCGIPTDSADTTTDRRWPHHKIDAGSPGVDASSPPVDASSPVVDASPPPIDAPPSTATSRFDVKLVADGGTGVQRINFAVPLADGVLSTPAIRVLIGTSEVAAARRVLARYPDGSARSIQLQVDVDVSAHQLLTVELGVTGATGPTLAAVDTTLTGSGNNVHPRVWAVLPPQVLVASGLGGPLVTASSVAGTSLDAWSTLCNYTQWDTDAFIPLSSSRDVWLYDRVTVFYRGHMVTGAMSPLKSAYREATIYRSGMTISNGVATAIPVPDASSDLKYYYSQGMALHYLMTGDDRFREAAEAVSARIAGMWNPTYTGAFWTERHAGFALLAHEWAARVTDDQATAINNRANAAVDAYLTMQNAPVANYTDANARCFTHSAASHDESYGYNGCSPWMSAILADALDAHARRVGGTRAASVRAALGKLGRIVARDGRDSTGRPFYWMGVGTTSDEADPYDEHWGEAAYIVALAWDATGRTDSTLRQAADALIAGLRQRGEVGQMRSFNWQCRSAVMTPALLK